MIVVVALLAGAIGFGLAVAANRARWLVFPLSGGAPLLGWMGGPGPIGGAQPIDVTCEHCGAPPGVSCPHDNLTVAQVPYDRLVDGFRRMPVEALDGVQQALDEVRGGETLDQALEAEANAPATFGVVCSSCDRVYTHVAKWSDAPHLPLCPDCRRAGGDVDLGYERD